MNSKSPETTLEYGLFALPFAAVLIAFGLGHLTLNPPVQSDMAANAQPAAPALERRYYIFPHGLRAVHGQAGAYLQADVVLVVEQPADAMGPMLARIDKSGDELNALLSTGFRDVISDAAGETDITALRIKLTQELRGVLNRHLSSEGAPDPITEVLFAGFIRS